MFIVAASGVLSETATEPSLLAHPIAVLAIPALLPAIILVGVILVIAKRDRVEERELNESAEAH